MMTPRRLTPVIPAPAQTSEKLKELPLRFLKDVGTVAYLYVYWKAEGGCDGLASLYHSATREFMRSEKLHDEQLGGPDEATPSDDLPPKCKRCDAERPENETKRHLFRKPLRAAPDGQIVHEPQPGDCYFAEHEYTVCPWDNCDGDHLVVVCPDGCHWDTSSRANNCSMKDDKTHRCWVLHGDPRKGELPTVDKGDHTCAAGAGSIQTGRYHGMLTGGVLRGD